MKHTNDSLFLELGTISIFLLAVTLVPVEGKTPPALVSENVPVVEQVLSTERLPEVQELKVKKTMKLKVTAYSSTVDQTDGDPFTTASGTRVHEGTIAHNGLPFGTRVRFPEAFGDKIFIVEDRMHPRKGFYMADIWMETREQAKQWGVRVVTMEILETPAHQIAKTSR